MPAKIILIRHGETDHNINGKFMGWQSDIGLNDHGRAHARAVATKLKNYRIDAMYNSDLRRAAETAAIVASELNISTQPEFLLRERNLAEFADKSLHELKETHPNWIEKFFDHANSTWCVPGGESLSDVHKRFRTLLTTLHSIHAGQTVLLVTHSGYLHTILRDVFGFFPVETFIEVTHDSVTMLEKENDTYHLSVYNQ